MSDDDRSLPKRVLAYEAVVETAIQVAHGKARHVTNPTRSRRRSERFTPGDIERRALDDDVDVSTRTVRRAMKDAAARGWVERSRYSQKFEPGERAEEYAPASELASANQEIDQLREELGDTDE